MNCVYGILHKKFYKMLGVRIDDQRENRDIELDMDVENIWTTENKSTADGVITNPATWFESTIKYPRHQFNPEDLVVIELSNQPNKIVQSTLEGNEHAIGFVTSFSHNISTNNVTTANGNSYAAIMPAQIKMEITIDKILGTSSWWQNGIVIYPRSIFPLNTP